MASPRRLRTPWRCLTLSAWQGDDVTETPHNPGEASGSRASEPETWLSLKEVAQRLGVPGNRVRQMVRDGALLVVHKDGEPRVPAELIANRTVLKHLPGVLTLLRDAGYNDEEALRWLYTADDSLPGRPVDGLSDSRATEVKRRAQALGF